MRAAIVSRFGGPETVEVVDLPLPEPGARAVRVRVAASSVQPIDLSTRAGRLTESGLVASRPMLGLGWDVAGVVDATGPGVERFAVGDRVIGLRDLLFALPGAHAEHVALDESALAPAPASASFVEAATLPLNALTADRALQLTGTRPGDTVLVTGAAGGVGGFALELARLRGLRTVAVAGGDDEPLVRRLGADVFVPRTDDVATAVRAAVPGGVDAVIDAASAGIAAHDAMRAGGTFVALVRPFAPPPIRGTTVVVAEVLADASRLAELSALADAGRLSLRVNDTLPLADAAAAHARLEAGGLRGRLVLEP